MFLPLSPSGRGTAAPFTGSFHLVFNKETVMMDAQNHPPQRQAMKDREAFWRMHCLSEPTFTDLTHGIFLGLVWSAVLWAPMFISVLL